MRLADKTRKDYLITRNSLSFLQQIDAMKDLDRLLSALVQDAESIPDIPYHAREDSLPFSYGIPGPAALKQRQEQQERLNQNQNQVPRQVPPPQRGPGSYSYSSPSTTFYSSPTAVQPPTSSPPLIQRDYTRQNSDTVFLEDFPDSSPYARPQYSSQSQPRVHNLRLEVEDQRSSKPGPSRSTPTRPSEYSTIYGNYNEQQQPPSRRYQSESGTIRENSYGESPRFAQHQPPPTSLSFNNFSNVYGSSSNGGGKRVRSQSADGRRSERDENADQWLQRQLQKLEEKKSRKYPV